MILQELFDELLEAREVKVMFESKAAGESLRTSLVKKWNRYKETMDSLGFLADDLVLCSLGCKAPAVATDPYIFTLAPRLRGKMNYEVVTVTAAPVRSSPMDQL